MGDGYMDGYNIYSSNLFNFKYDEVCCGLIQIEHVKNYGLSCGLWFTILKITISTLVFKYGSKLVNDGSVFTEKLKF